MRYYDTWKEHTERDARYKVIEGISWQFNDIRSNLDDINVEADLGVELSSRIHCQQSSRNITNIQIKTYFDISFIIISL